MITFMQAIMTVQNQKMLTTKMAHCTPVQNFACNLSPADFFCKLAF